MAHFEDDVEEIVGGIYREFFATMGRNQQDEQYSAQWRDKLFGIAVRKLRAIPEKKTQELDFSGRDTRKHKSREVDYLSLWRTGKIGKTDWVDVELVLEQRVQFLSFELRVMLVLHDLMGFGSDEVTQILELRWGIVRHRLHRARCEWQRLVRGSPLVGTGTDSSRVSSVRKS
jgi:DNA-directed RNA polymerase specialized sigma24 family protein